MAIMTVHQRVMLLAFFCLTLFRGAFLSMLSQGQVSVLHAGQAIILDCEFYTEYFNLFDNPVLWKKTQRKENTQVNIMGNIVEPFVSTGRFDVTFERLPPRYRLMLKIVDLALEDSGNYTCEVRGPRSSVLGVVTHYIFVRAPVKTIYISDSNSTEKSEFSRISSLSLKEGKPTTVGCVSEGGYPPPEMEIYLGNRDLTEHFSIRHSSELHGIKGLRLMIYRTERWTDRLKAEAADDGDLLKCLVTVPGLGSNISHAKVHVQYAPILKCDTADAFLGDKNVFLRCEVKARPGVLALYWSIGNGTTVAPGEVINEQWTLNTDRGDVLETKLFLRLTRDESFKTYTLVAENVIAKTSRDVQLVQKYRNPTKPPALKIVESGSQQSSSSHGRRSESGYKHTPNASRAHHHTFSSFIIYCIFISLLR